MATKKPSPFDNLKVSKSNLRQSINWFQTQIKLLSRSSYQQKALMGEASRMTISPVPGRMYLYKYDAITKESLPYWDAFPCIFFIEKLKKNGHSYWYGLNLHYLPPDLRLKLLVALYDLANNDRFDATTRLKLSYQILMRLSKAKNLGADFAFKMYREDGLGSRFLEVSSSAWPMVALLPVEAFQKASKQKVWHDAKQAR
jgi:hypothetical protein